MHSAAILLMTSDDHQGPGSGRTPRPKQSQDEDELAYRVELWNAEMTAVERVLAVTTHASIGQAAFYAAAREFVDRYVTLRHKGRIINRWTKPAH